MLLGAIMSYNGVGQARPRPELSITFRSLALKSLLMPLLALYLIYPLSFLFSPFFFFLNI